MKKYSSAPFLGLGNCPRCTNTLREAMNRRRSSDVSSRPMSFESRSSMRANDSRFRASSLSRRSFSSTASKYRSGRTWDVTETSLVNSFLNLLGFRILLEIDVSSRRRYQSLSASKATASLAALVSRKSPSAFPSRYWSMGPRLSPHASRRKDVCRIGHLQIIPYARR